MRSVWPNLYIMTITITNKDFSSNVNLEDIMSVMTMAPYYQDYLALAEAGQKLPSKKQLRMMSAFQALMGKD